MPTHRLSSPTPLSAGGASTQRPFGLHLGFESQTSHTQGIKKSTDVSSDTCLFSFFYVWISDPFEIILLHGEGYGSSFLIGKVAYEVGAG